MSSKSRKRPYDDSGPNDSKRPKKKSHSSNDNDGGSSNDGSKKTREGHEDDDHELNDHDDHSVHDNGNGNGDHDRDGGSLNGDEYFAECPFAATVLRESAKDAREGRLEKGWTHSRKHGSRRAWAQDAPFQPNGRFKKGGSLDAIYVVEPEEEWQAMTRYNSFVLNGVKFCVDDFIYVANDQTFEQPLKPPKTNTKRPDEHWVAKVLEIRAADEHHVYARLYWMYWPDELPAGLMGAKRTTAGRQPYHGKHELVASNHMDIINVFSVATAADVKQWVESDDDSVQDALYWRQALDCRTMELSTVDLICRCATPANPDELLIGCTNPICGTWMHHDCLLDSILTQVHDRLCDDTPQSASTGASLIRGGNRPRGLGMRSAVNEEKEETITLDTARPTAASKRASTGRKAKLKKPYSGLLEARLRLDKDPPIWEITDKRGDSGDGDEDRTWTERVNCLVCESVID